MALGDAHCICSVLTISVKILPYRPPAWLIRANHSLKIFGGSSPMKVSD